MISFRIPILLLVVATLVACGDDESASTTDAAAKQNAQAQAAAAESEKDTDGDGIRDIYDPEPTVPDEPAPTREAPDDRGSYEMRCDYELGDFGDSGDPSQGYRFVAGGTLRNTGNIGIRVRVTYKWKLLGRDPLTVRKHYRLRRGQSRDVNLTVPVTENDIDSHQSAAGDCSTKVTIVATFGVTPYE